jgi:hypothetical protein
MMNLDTSQRETSCLSGYSRAGGLRNRICIPLPVKGEIFFQKDEYEQIKIKI